jgi:hypothetical protein
MSFTQTMEVQAGDESALRDHVAGWHAEQAGIAPGYRRSRILADTKQSAPEYRDYRVVCTTEEV